MIPRPLSQLNRLVWGCLVLCGWGCSQQAPRERPPSIDPVAAGAAAIAEYDSNHDGVLSAEELGKCPSLKSAVARIDPQKTGKITADAIAARIKQWQTSQLASTSVLVAVRLDGAPLAGATVTAEPEKFLGESIAAAHGVSDAAGNAVMRTDSKPGMHCGFYKIRISKLVDGREALPARYNRDTELGIEVALDVLSQGGVNFDLASR